MSESSDAAGPWQLDLVEDVDLPGWVWLPEDFEPGQRDGWIDETVPALQELLGEQQADGTPTTAADFRALLEAALDARAESDSYSMYQIWPVRAAAAVMCHVNRVQTEDLPDLASLEGRFFAADARHIGPGVQISSRIAVESPEGALEAMGVYFVFADEDHAVLVHLDPAMPELIAHSLLGVGLFINALEVTRGDGSTFTSTKPSGLIPDDEWNTDSAGVS